MPKTGLKTFVYSFSVSLLTLFVVNGVYWHENSPSNQQITLPDSNITLFLNNTPGNPSTRPAPVKKIALTVLAEAKPEAARQKSETAPPETEVIMADADVLEIPLEIAGVAPPARAKTKPVKTTENVAAPVVLVPKAERVRQAGQELTPEQPQTQAAPALKMALLPDPVVEKVAEPVLLVDENIPLDRVVVAAPSPAPKAEPLSEPVVLAQAKPLVAQSEPPIAQAQKIETKSAPQEILVAENETPSAIPLQRIRDVWVGHDENIKIAGQNSANQVALTDKNVPIKSMAENNVAASGQQSAEAPDETRWEKMADQVSTGNPWVVAKGAVASSNGMAKQQQYYQADDQKIKEALGQNNQATDAGVKVASETVKNLLIPIPEDILNDENLTPQLVSSKKPEDIRKEMEVETQLKETVRKDGTGMPASATGDDSKMIADNTDKPEAKKSTILNSLSSIFSSSSDIKKAMSPTTSSDNSMVASLKKKFKKQNQVRIMPTEMRLSFQPNRAEISGQTLRWIQAFAAKAAEDNATLIEIRIDGTSATELQQKRLNLLHNILTNKGVEYGKINTVFTQREPNSFIIRTVRLNNVNTRNNGNMDKPGAGYYLQW